MAFDLFSISYLIGTAFTLLLILVLIAGKHRLGVSKILLVGLLLCIGVVLLQQAFVAGGKIGIWKKVFWLVMGMWFAISPLLFLYLRSVIKPDFHLKRSHIFLFIIPIYLTIEWGLNQVGIKFKLRKLFANPMALTFWWIFIFLSTSLALTVASYFDVTSIKSNVRRFEQISWLKWLLMAFSALLVFSIILLVFLVSTKTYMVEYEHWLLIAYEAFVYGLVFKMLSSTSFFDDLSRQRYANSRLTENNLAELYEKLNSAMRIERPYLDRKLSLESLAKKVHIPENQLSQIFSQHIGSNFYDFVNQYRLEELEKKLLDPEWRHLKILAIAEDCGFNSKAAFYKSFRKKHGMTPSEYMAKNQNAGRA